MSIDLNIVIICVTVLLAVRMVMSGRPVADSGEPEREPPAEAGGGAAEASDPLTLGVLEPDDPLVKVNGDLSLLTDDELAIEWTKIENRAKVPHSESPIERKQKLALEIHNRDKDRRRRENL